VFREGHVTLKVVQHCSDSCCLLEGMCYSRWVTLDWGKKCQWQDTPIHCGISFGFFDRDIAFRLGAKQHKKARFLLYRSKLPKGNITNRQLKLTELCILLLWEFYFLLQFVALFLHLKLILSVLNFHSDGFVKWKFYRKMVDVTKSSLQLFLWADYQIRWRQRLSSLKPWAYLAAESCSYSREHFSYYWYLR